MEGGFNQNNIAADDDENLKEALIGEKNECVGGIVRLIGGYSVNSVRDEFLSRLPSKVRGCFDAEFSSADFSKVSGLVSGEKEYYERQFCTIKSFEEVDAIMETDSLEEEDLEEKAKQERAITISNYANFFLLALKIYADAASGSLVIAVATLDSLFDLMAGVILWLTHLSMKSININKYPIGESRVQPVGIIIFAAVMATLGMAFRCWFRH